jgi:hypothetical protein
VQTIRAAAPADGRDWKDAIGRIGLVGRGVLYGVVALLALELAIGSPDGEASSDGALAWLASRPFGKFLLVVMTIALFSLAIWRLLDALVGDPVEGDDASDRARFLAKSAVYFALAFGALSTTMANWGSSTGAGSGSGDGDSERKATGVVLDWPMGRWLVAAVGLGVVGYAVFMFKHHAVDEKFMKRLSTDSNLVHPLGRFGYGARSVVWAIVGLLLLQAAATYDPSKAGGLSTALQKLAATAGGPWLLGLVAIGLFSFGAFCVAEARFRTAA